MPHWLKSLFARAGRAIDRLSDVVERFTALMCLALVVPMVLAADIALVLWGQQGRDRLKEIVDYQAYIGTYLGVTAAIALMIVLYAELGPARTAARVASAIDRAMLPIAYTASALMAIFAALMWLQGAW